MTISYMRCVAYCCAQCEAINVKEIQVFELPEGSVLPLVCACGAHCMDIVYKKDKVHITDRCNYCGDTHRYIINKRSFWSGAAVEFCCTYNKRLSRFMLGDSKEVEEYVEEQQMILDEVSECSDFIDELELELGLYNETVLLSALERIHEIARQGNIFCTCGGDIEFCLESGSIKLICGECGSAEEVYAATEQDLQDIMNRKSIVITRAEHKPSPR